MIRRIELSNWRAYDHLELDLTKPVTFIVAPNGVGKSSLIEAVRWATFGAIPGGAKKRVVRLGAREATVELTIEIPSAPVHVKRTLTASGKSSFAGSRDGVELTEREYLRTLTEAWAAEPDLLANLLFGEAGTQAEEGFPIRDHLAEAFGITPFVNAASTIEDRLKTLRVEIKNRRAEVGIDPGAIGAAEGTVRQLESVLSDAKQRLKEAQETATSFAEIGSAAHAWSQYRTSLDKYNARTKAAIDQLSALVDVPEGDSEELIVHAQDEVQRELDIRRSDEAEARVQAAASGSALELLGPDLEVCPTCRRPLSERERVLALQFHEAHLDGSSELVHGLHQAVELAQRKLNTIRELSRELRATRAPALPSVPEPSAAQLEQAAFAQKSMIEATEVAAAAEARFDDARGQLKALMLAAKEDAALVAAYAEEGVLQMAQDALRELETRYMTDRIQPLTDEIARRWKLLFGSEGLRLDHDGSLRLQLGDEFLELGDLSGGERVIALFVARLLVVASATRATTLWLDEPLEHLDPRRRAVVARTIVKAAEQHALDQVIVTTYEERLAHQLEATAPTVVAVEHVRATPKY